MRQLLSLLFCLSLHPAVSAQELSKTVFTIAADLKTNANSVVRLHEKVYTVSSPKVATIYEHKIVTVLKDGHNGANRLVVYYDGDSKITRFKATIYDALGEKIRSASKDEIEDIRYLTGGQFYTESRVRTTKMDHPSYPYTVEFEYERKLTNFGVFEFPQWLPLQYDQSVQEATFTAIVPEDNELLYHQHDLPEPARSQENGLTTLRWSVKNLPAVVYEADAPPMTRTLPYLRTTLKKFNAGDYEGSMESWEAYGAFMQQLIVGRDELPPSLQALVRETTAGLTTDREKINALYQLLQDRTRYVGVQLGIGGIQPFPASYVEENRYGDCKALSNYMGAMLTEIGIKSYPVLVDSDDDSFFPVDENFTTSAFNHMILYVPSEDMYLECTSSDYPTGYLGEGKENRNVLWVTPEGGKLVKTPALRAVDNSALRTVNIKIAAEGSAEFRLNGRYYGALQEAIRSFADQEKDQGEQLKVLERVGMLPDVSGTDYALTYVADRPEAQLQYTTELPAYVRKMGTRMFVPVNKYYAYDDVPDKLESRRFPISRRLARFYVDTINLSLPENMEVESSGEPLTEISHAAGEYRAELLTLPGKVRWVRTLKLLPVELPATAYEDYRQFFIDVAKAENRQVVLRKKRTK